MPTAHPFSATLLMATVLVGADICPIERGRPLFEAGDADALFHDLLPDLRQADYSIVNLECPLIHRPTPILTTGPTFGESPRCIAGLKAAGIRAVGLANNHIMDHGPEGLASTLEACRAAGIETVGAGPDLAQAGQPLLTQIGKLRLAILATAEREFSIAGPDKPGANPLDLIATTRRLAELRTRSDFRIVLYHGGDEFLVPSPRVQDTCRFLVEMGADAVFVQHPHVLGGIETHLGRPIVYGQGALVMDEAIYRSRASFHEGFLARLNIADDATSTLDILPFEQFVTTTGARRLSGERDREFRRSLAERSARLADPEAVAREWKEFCLRNQNSYMSSLLAHGRILGRLNRSGWVTRSLYRRTSLLQARNVALCETHREVVQTLFEGGWQP